MAEQLAYVLVTPHTIRKSRTGVVIARLLARVSAELVATRVFALTSEQTERFSKTIHSSSDPDLDFMRSLIREYVLKNFSFGSDSRCPRLLMLVFSGENAFEEVADVVGHIVRCSTGETLRDSYGELVMDEEGNVAYFEPAVLTADSAESVFDELDLWMDFARCNSPLIDGVCTYDCPADRVEQTLVLIKPDSWRQQSSRPGAVIDMFSRTGLRIISSHLVRMSVNQALEFYGPVESVLVEKLSPRIAVRAREVLEEEFDFSFSGQAESALTESVGLPYARNEFERIIEFMTGYRPGDCAASDRSGPGRVTSLALVYEGECAVRKIRDVLGPTDPTKAPSGTVRREFGSSVMVNTAHASDGVENARREMGILGIREDRFCSQVRRAMAECGGSAVAGT